LLLTGCATPYVRPAAPDTLAPALYPDHAVMADGYALPLTVWRPPAAVPVRAVMLALHGLNDYRHAYAELGPYLAARGIITYAYDLRGFGATAAPGVWHGGRRLAEDLRSMAALLRATYPGQPLYAMGESLGGAVLLSALQPTPPDIDGMILVAPAVWARDTMPLLQRITLWLGAHIMPATTVTGRFLHIKPSDNRPMLRALSADPLVIKATRIDVLYGTAGVMDRAFAAAPRLLMPSLILYGQHDEIIPKTPVCDMLEELPRGAQRRWRMAYYPDGYHMLTRDLHRATVLRDIAAWLANPRATLPSGDEIMTGDNTQASFCGAQPTAATHYVDSK
jgi:acylglycerol lipase